MNNIYGDSAYAEIQAELHEQLEALRNQYGDSNALNQQFIEEYKEKVKKNPYIEYWKFPREELMKIFGMQSEDEEEE